jgi:hypothetical protein
VGNTLQSTGGASKFNPWEVRLVVRKVQPVSLPGLLGMGLGSATERTEVVGALVIDMAKYAACGQQRLTLPITGGFSPPRLTISVAMRSLTASVPGSPASSAMPSPQPKATPPPPPQPQPLSDAESGVVGCTRRLQDVLLSPLAAGWLPGWANLAGAAWWLVGGAKPPSLMLSDRMQHEDGRMRTGDSMAEAEEEESEPPPTTTRQALFGGVNTERTHKAGSSLMEASESISGAEAAGERKEQDGSGSDTGEGSLRGQISMDGPPDLRGCSDADRPEGSRGWALWGRKRNNKQPRNHGSVGSELELDLEVSPAPQAAEKRGWFSFGSRKKAKVTTGGATDHPAAAAAASPMDEAPVAAAAAVPEQWAAVVPASGEEEQEQLQKALHMSRVQSEGGLNSLTVVGRISRVPSAAILAAPSPRYDACAPAESGEQEEKATTTQEEAEEEADAALTSGQWHAIELHDEARATVVPADVHFGTLDQRGAGGPGACSVLAVRVASWLLANTGRTPTGAQLDELMHDGVAAWKLLCEDEGNRARFPDLHLDLETALAAQEASPAVCVCRERSFVGFLQPKGLQPGDCPVLDSMMEGVMPLETIWKELRAVGPAVFLVSWNDHFFTLQTHANGDCLLIDSLGERLHAGCQRAYMLRFAAQQPGGGGGGGGDDDDNGDSSGLHACATYVSHVVPEVALQSLADDVAADARLVKEGKASRLDPLSLLRPLQIEFQFVSQAVIDAHASAKARRRR